MGTTYEMLKDRVEKLGDILSAVNFDSPVVASHLLVGACVEMSRIGGVLIGLKYPPYLHKLLVLGYSYANSIEKPLTRVKQELDRCEVLSHEYYHAFSRMREYGRPVYDEGIKERSAYAKCSIDPLLDDDMNRWKRMASLVENASYGNSPSCVSPLPDLHPYHEYVWEIIYAMNRAIKVIIASAQQIDAFVAKPTAEMVAYWMENVFETFRDKRWKDSFVRKIFEAERKKARFKRHGRNKESELDFLEKELESFSKGCSDSLLEDALVRHYDEMTGECNFEKAAQYVLPYWDSVKDESSECLEDYVENLMMIRYVMDEIACISGEQKAKDEATDFYIEDEGNINEVADLSKGDVISKSKRSKNNSGRSLIFRTEEEQRKWAESFNEFLKKHKQFNEKGLTKEKNSYINRALAFFVDAWKKEGIYNTESYNKAPTEFLYCYCGIRGIEPKTHGNACQQIIKDCLDNKDDAILQAQVSEWVKEHL